MQNVDFSKKLRREEGSISSPSSPRGRGLAVTASICTLAFAAGIMLGLQIGKRDSDIIRHPDKLPDETSAKVRDSARVGVDDPAENPTETVSIPANSGNHANTHFSDTGAPSKYLVKLGTFRTGEADKLASKLSRMSEFSEMTAFPCKGLKESPGRGIAFRIAVKGQDKENVFLGCFPDAAKAHEALAAIKTSGIAAAGQATLFEIE